MKSIKITTERVLSALFLLGYDKIDPMLYSLIVGKLAMLPVNTFITDYSFYFEDDCLSKTFSACIKPSTSICVEFKDGVDFSTDVSKYCNLEDGTITLYEFLNSIENRFLADYIAEYIDLNEIMQEKYTRLGKRSIDNCPELYSSRELNYLTHQKKKNRV